jgi:CheY-like chemotaxis protein
MPHSGLQIRTPNPVNSGRSALRSTRTVAALLIDDDAAIVSALSEALSEEGFEVATAANGREALQMLRRGLRPSVIILDLMMPVMDGWDFRQEQLRDPALKDLPVVVATAAGFSASTISAQFGSVEFLPKPVLLPCLYEIVGRVARPASSAA